MAAVSIPGRNDAFFAESATGDFYFLVSGSSGQSGSSSKLNSLRIHSGSNYRLHHSDGTETQSSFVYACLDNNSTHLISTFGLVCGVLLHSLPNKPDEEDLRRLLDDFLELFSMRGVVDRSTVVGLWGEMWVLDQFASDELALAWHSDPYDRFDFALVPAFVEVKTTEQAVARHTFALAQLLPQAKRTLVASLSITPDSSGRTVADLLVSVLSKVSASAGARVSRICLATLAGDLEAAADFSFSPAGAEPLRVFDAADIPRVVVPDLAPISQVVFAVDLATCVSVVGGLGLILPDEA